MAHKFTTLGHQYDANSSYGMRIGSTENRQRFKRKVSAYQKPTKPMTRSRRKYQKSTREYIFQNQSNERRYSPIRSGSVESHKNKNVAPNFPQSQSYGTKLLRMNNDYSASNTTTPIYHPREYQDQSLFSQTNLTPELIGNNALQPRSYPYSSQSNHPTQLNQMGSNATMPHMVQDHNSNVQSQFPYPPPLPKFQLSESANKLLLSLDSNLINFVASQNSSPNAIPVPILTDKTSLRIRRQNVIDALYNKEDKQCGVCSLRFPRQHTQELAEHLDAHFLEQRQNKQRMWYTEAAKIINRVDDVQCDMVELEKKNDAIMKCSLCL